MNISSLLVGVCCAAALAAGLSSCASSPKVTREDPSAQIDVSGGWNDTDSQMVSTEMVKDALSSAWVDEFTRAHNAKPRVIVGTVLNKSHEHIAADTFVKDLERELTNDGSVVFVAARVQREEVRDERADMAQNASPETVKPAGQEYGADFMLQGQINTIIDQAGAKAVRYYQVELELINMTTNEKAWIGQKKIKKFVKRGKVRL